MGREKIYRCCFYKCDKYFKLLSPLVKKHLNENSEIFNKYPPEDYPLVILDGQTSIKKIKDICQYTDVIYIMSHENVSIEKAVDVVKCGVFDLIIDDNLEQLRKSLLSIRKYWTINSITNTSRTPTQRL